MQQAALFNDYPELEIGEAKLTSEDRVNLEKIAKSVADIPFIEGEYRVFKKENRLDVMLKYIKGEKGDVADYLIRSNGEIVGYLGVWNGWVRSSMNQTMPKIEVGFLKPEYMKEIKQIKDKKFEILLEVQKKYDDF